MTIQPEPECDRCSNPVGNVVNCCFAYDGYGEERLNACEACRPESHYRKCDDCKQEFVIDQLTSHEDITVLPPAYKSKSLCAKCKALAVERDNRTKQRELAGYKDPPYGDEHYFYDVPWRR